MIIDCHVHVDRKFGWDHSPSVVKCMMKEAGIDGAIITTYTDLPSKEPGALERFLADLEGSPEFLGGLLRLNPWYLEDCLDIMERSKGRKVVGIKLHPVTTLLCPFHPNVIRLLKLCGELGWMALFHTGDDPLSLPLQVAKAAREASDTPIILGHMGGLHYVEEALMAAKRCKNLYLEPSGMPYPQAIRSAVKQLGAKRVIFGSDMPPMNPKLELRKYAVAGIKGEEREMILHRNVAELLGLKGL